MSSSKERVGGVEPETVRLYRWRYEDWRTSWRCEWRPPLSPGGTEETAEFVPLSALRLVEEELRQAREGLAQAHDHITAMENGQHPSHTWVHPEDMPCPDGRHLRYVEHVTKLSWLTDWEWQRQRADRAETDRDRLAEALREIADQDWVENVLDPQWAARIAEAALSPVFQGASEVGRSESATPLHMGKDSPEGREQCREHVRGGGNHENAEAGSSPRLHPSTASPDLTDPPVQGEHEQGEPVWKNVPPLEDFMARIGMPLDGEHEQDRCPKCGAHEMTGGAGPIQTSTVIHRKGVK